jgi:pilus assembly protein Flp/PilA
MKDEIALTLAEEELLTLRAVNPQSGRGPEEGGVIAIRTMLRKLGADKRGATAIEYGLIASLIVVAMIGALESMGGGVGGMWSKIGGAANNYMP